MIYRRLLAFLLSFALIFSSTSALATTSVGGWSALDTITAGANNTINAVKGAGATGMRSAVTVAASASKVGKHLLKGGGAAALAFAMIELGDGAIDWILDPANNSVRVTPAAGAGGQDVTCSKNGYFILPDLPKYANKESLCKATAAKMGLTYSKVFSGYQCQMKRTDGSPYNLDIQGGGGCSVTAPDYIAPSSPAPYNIPIDTVAAKVIANAAAGHAESQEAVKATALEGFAAGEHDAALDAAAVPDTGVENPTDPENPPKDPAVPFDPSSIIAAINALKAMLAGILSSITSLADWFKGEPEGNKPEDNKIDIPEVPLPEPDTDISFGGSCPSDLGADFNLYGTNFNFVLMPFSKLCPLLSTFVKPTLILLGSFMAVAIVGGRKDA
ncbi:hypothetical protein FQ082_09315 [Psychrobacter sp. ANT_H56B]|uniref:virulence factor TspB C-terminal domain-related protein n=1 Tax=Psychrobacter sp. ANT_H56B TaxID=2597353 RepID=UPI0011F269D0|nr:virulence factor TspB C-terminal domain-related protein [Psychrobacter sp. ANT_H56B]KAA0924787.1 hypothetical protein FQ082_09315 [Psychrobacter sp. ANT_H56B]